MSATPVCSKLISATSSLRRHHTHPCSIQPTFCQARISWNFVPQKISMLCYSTLWHCQPYFYSVNKTTPPIVRQQKFIWNMALMWEVWWMFLRLHDITVTDFCSYQHLSKASSIYLRLIFSDGAFIAIHFTVCVHFFKEHLSPLTTTAIFTFNRFNFRQLVFFEGII